MEAAKRKQGFHTVTNRLKLYPRAYKLTTEKTY